MHDNNSEERLELERISSDLMRELKFRYLIIDNFIPEQEKTRFLRKIYYDENDEEWHYRSSNQLSNNGNESQNPGIGESDMETSIHSRPGTAVSRPSSVYNSSQSNMNGSLYSSLYGDVGAGKSSKLFLGFKVPFYRGNIEQLGLYLPERTTMDYDSYLVPPTSTEIDEADDDCDVEIDIM